VRVLVDVDVAPRLEGHGLGSRLVEGALDHLRAGGHRGRPARAICRRLHRSAPRILGSRRGRP
jgi:GNAT superfamily N-acetyltransferase